MADAPPFAPEGLDHVVPLVDGMAETRRCCREAIGCSVDKALPQRS